MRSQIARRIATGLMVGALSFTLVACPSSDDEDTEESAPENESESPENESEAPENESESPENDSEAPENENEG